MTSAISRDRAQERRWSADRPSRIEREQRVEGSGQSQALRRDTTPEAQAEGPVRRRPGAEVRRTAREQARNDPMALQLMQRADSALDARRRRGEVAPGEAERPSRLTALGPELPEAVREAGRELGNRAIEGVFDTLGSGARDLFGERAGELVDDLRERAGEALDRAIDRAPEALANLAFDRLEGVLEDALGERAGGAAASALDAWARGEDPIRAAAGALLDPALGDLREEIDRILGPELGGVANAAIGAAAQSAVTGGLGSLSAGAALSAAGPAAAAALIGPPSISGIEAIINNEKLDTREQVALAFSTFGASFLYNPARRLFGSKKSPEQRERDQVRDALRQTGLGPNLEFNGVQGNIRFDYGTGQLANIDQSDPLAREAVSLTMGLAQVVTNGKERLAEDMNAIFANAVLGQGLRHEVPRTETREDLVENTRRLMEAVGLSPRDAARRMATLWTEGRVTTDELRVTLRALGEIEGRRPDVRRRR